jgi:phosphate transport system substrate-binding protein
MSRASVVRITIIVLVGAALCVAAYYAPGFFIKEDKSTVVHLKTGGTSVAQILMENRWRTTYLKEKGIEVDYDSTGSTSGVQRMIDKQYVIGFTHAPLTEKQKKQAQEKGGEVVQIPVALCAVVPIYNLKELKGEGKPPLKFNGEVLAGIFLGKIKKWNHPALQKLNEQVTLPDTDIIVVHREDSSGTTKIFAEYLAGASTAWPKDLEVDNKVNWPVEDKERTAFKSRNHGVAMHVMVTEGAIGYVDLLHAYGEETLQYGAVENKEHAFIHAEAKNMTAAVKEVLAEGSDELALATLTNRPGKESYPICGAIWAVCYQNQPASSQKDVVDFLTWVTHDGQQYAQGMSYAPLPEELTKRAEQKLKSIKVAP